MAKVSLSNVIRGQTDEYIYVFVHITFALPDIVQSDQCGARTMQIQTVGGE